MDDMRPMSEVAELAGVDRNTLARWVKAKKLKSRTAMVRNLKATLVSLSEVKALVAKGVRPGRPRKDAK